MTAIPRAMRRLAAARARGREYCKLAQVGQVATFHIDHIVPESEGGKTVPANLALACVTCSLRKGSRQAGLDGTTGVIAALFHPRKHRWQNHFRWRGVILMGLTPIGRATIAALKLNHARLVGIRK